MTLWIALNGLLVALAYVLGSIPPGYWAGKLLKGIDIREHGSGSTGATNVLRTLGKGPALVVLLVDVLKGAIAIALVYGFDALDWTRSIVPTGVDLATWQPWLVTLAGSAVLLGHSKSILLNFSGGKSVATSLGVLLTLDWRVGLGTLAVFLLLLLVFRIVSLSSIAGAIATSGLMVATQQPLPYLLFSIAGGLYVIFRHRGNIQRLFSGTEPRLGQSIAEFTTPQQS